MEGLTAVQIVQRVMDVSGNSLSSVEISVIYSQLMTARNRLSSSAMFNHLQDRLQSEHTVAVDRENRMSREERQDKDFKDSTYTVNERIEMWFNKAAVGTFFDKMTLKELKEAEKALDAGYRCYGQQHKIITIKRLIKEMENAVK